MNGFKTPFSLGLKFPITPVMVPVRILPQQAPPKMGGGGIKQGGQPGAIAKQPGERIPANAEDILADPTNPQFWKIAKQVIESTDYWGNPFWLKKDHAIPALVKIGTLQAIALLVKALGDANPIIRELAAYHLGGIRTDDALTAVTQAATAGKGADDTMRQAATWALGQMHNTDTLPTLIANLADTNPLVAEQAARSIAMTGDGDATVAALVAQSKKAASDVKVAITEALAAIGGTDAVSTLSAMTQDGNPEIRAAALMGLAQADKAAFLQQLPNAVKDMKAQSRVAALLAIRSLWERESNTTGTDDASNNALTDTISALLNDDDFAVQAWALDDARRLLQTLRRVRPLPKAWTPVVAWLVGRLIEQLKAVESARLQAEIVAMLESVTGVNIGRNGDEWAKWWRDAKNTFTPFRSPAEAPKIAAPTVVAEPPHFYATPITATNSAFVLDLSGGMTQRNLALYGPDGTLVDGNIGKTKALAYIAKNPGSRMEFMPSKADEVLTKLSATIEAMPKGSDVTIVIMNTEAAKKGGSSRRFGRKLVTAQDRKALQKQIADAKESLQKLSRGRGDITAVAEAITQAMPEAVYVWTDGNPTAGEYMMWSNIHDWLTRLNRYRGVALHWILSDTGQLEEILPVANDNMGTVR